MAKKKQTKLPIQDEDRFHEMSKPFKDAETADEAIRSFHEAVYDLRCKYKIANVSVVIKDAVAGQGQFMNHFHAGNQLEEESMAAWHLGMASSDRQEIIRKAMEQGAKNALKEKKSQA